jgi:hypothetical protein
MELRREKSPATSTLASGTNINCGGFNQRKTCPAPMPRQRHRADHARSTHPGQRRPIRASARRQSCRPKQRLRACSTPLSVAIIVDHALSFLNKCSVVSEVCAMNGPLPQLKPFLVALPRGWGIDPGDIGPVQPGRATAEAFEPAPMERGVLRAPDGRGIFAGIPRHAPP